ncbi:hypothetical protein [uncultured Methylobacterium sp.]|uniref:hypothetical protein n=1 Tax=uncultured Methylobacterium sp. TaxID=157278 RepID=UPI00261B3BA4|nr:hypothetical protein [uncultured Methylobacterium sp.]
MKADSPLPPPDPLADARALHDRIAALKQALILQSRQLDALERSLAPRRTPAQAGAQRLLALKPAARSGRGG